MTSIPPPHGMSDFDYESIEAAVTETVRGRWFLNEFARRTRAAEGQQLLDAVNRLEGLVLSGQTQTALPPPQSADPSIRLLVQRIKEIAGRLEGVASSMREAGIDARFWQAVNLQARAVAGLMRTGTASRATPVLPALAPPDAVASVAPIAETIAAPHPVAQIEPAAVIGVRLSSQSPLDDYATRAPAARAEPVVPDARLSAFSGLDGLPLAKKIALFS